MSLLEVLNNYEPGEGVKNKYHGKGSYKDTKLLLTWL